MFTRCTVWEYSGATYTTDAVWDNFQPAWCMGSIPHCYLCTFFYYTQCITHVYRHLEKVKKEKVCCTISRTDTHLNTSWKIKPGQRLTNLASSWCYHCAACSAHVQYAASGLPIRHLPLWVVDSISPYSLHRTCELYSSYSALEKTKIKNKKKNNMQKNNNNLALFPGSPDPSLYYLLYYIQTVRAGDRRAWERGYACTTNNWLIWYKQATDISGVKIMFHCQSYLYPDAGDHSTLSMIWHQVKFLG